MIRGADGPTEFATRVVPDDPDEALEALNKRAGEILLEQKIVAATTPQLMNAIALAEADLGFSYDEVRRRQLAETTGGEQTVMVDGAPMVVGAESIEQNERVVAALVERGLTLESATQEQILEAASRVIA